MGPPKTSQLGGGDCAKSLSIPRNIALESSIQNFEATKCEGSTRRPSPDETR